MALNLIRPKHRSLTNPSLIHLFSTSSNSNSDDTAPPSASSSSFSDLKASLKHPQQERPTPPSPPKPTKFSLSGSAQNSSRVTPFDEIRKNLAEFRNKAAKLSSSDQSSSKEQPAISFQELYKKNVLSKSEESNTGSAESAAPTVGRLSFDAIRESLRQMRTNNANKLSSQPPPQQGLRLTPRESSAGSRVIGGTQELPLAVFGKEMRGKTQDSGELTTEFVKMYSYGELGTKLKMLRPQKKEGDWFSLQELQSRLIKLREMEEKETEAQISGISFKDLRESLVKLRISDSEKNKKAALQRLNILDQLGGTPSFMMHPPKPQLVEKYFHPDNMSSAEKMKLELAKVRGEFKMSESDCGSARVQVAQLTTKIKHLSSVLHKKDKHSRKGLEQMVQKRKKLLKYLRRTDWPSYCFVLERLGLRDKPDYKL